MYGSTAPTREEWRPVRKTQVDVEVPRPQASGAADDGAMMHVGAGAGEEPTWSWRDYIQVNAGSVRVSLSGRNIRDADLDSLTRFLREWQECNAGRFPHALDLTLDLSCNPGISDYGIAVHIVPLLRKWPCCRRLKLYQTSVGDRALRALTPWISRGYAHELHLSDLGGELSSEVVLNLLRAIHGGGRYPYWKNSGGRASLWLRLEHNLLKNADEIVTQLRWEGMSIRILSRAELSSVRPGEDLRRRGQDNPEVILVLFRLQQRKELVQDDRVHQGREILSLLGKSGAEAGPGPSLAWGLPRPEPQPLSVDEFMMWEMQQREDAEGGADLWNEETFGEDVAQGGWTFEENLAANEWLAGRSVHDKIGGQLGGWQQEAPAAAAAATAYDYEGGQVAAAATATAAEGVAQASCGTGGQEKEADHNGTSSYSGVVGRGQHLAKWEVESAITTALQLVPMLHRLDFDGQVRQYLHAIRNRAGRRGVLQAVQEVRVAMQGKTRDSVRKWPAYLVVLLKRFLAHGLAPSMMNAPLPADVEPDEWRRQAEEEEEKEAERREAAQEREAAEEERERDAEQEQEDPNTQL